MARIIYKTGHEGQNKLECIEGIEIELLNGDKALVYPKYSERVLLSRDKISKWNAPEETEIDALKLKSAKLKTYSLVSINSPAAIWVDQFSSFKFDSQFSLPTLLAALEIQRQKKNIDALAETIEGADLLRDFTNYVWSCSRCDKYGGWVVNGNYGFAHGSSSYSSYLAVPTVLYR